ncbi:MAG: chaperone modulator CbpM [Filimonas sp.]|nr:chaperone modulator CbpM [Filimonas sp.]
METTLITTETCCIQYNIEPSFIDALEEFELIHITVQEQQKYIHPDELHDLEKYIHLHYDLNINMEGMDVINHLLHRVKEMQTELIQLRGRM